MQLGEIAVTDDQKIGFPECIVLLEGIGRHWKPFMGNREQQVQLTFQLTVTTYVSVRNVTVAIHHMRHRMMRDSGDFLQDGIRHERNGRVGPVRAKPGVKRIGEVPFQLTENGNEVDVLNPCLCIKLRILLLDGKWTLRPSDGVWQIFGVD